MTHSPPRGLFTLSVDVRGTQDNRTQALALRVLKTLRQARVPATWSSVSPGDCRFGEHVLREPLPHEIALLAEVEWAGAQAGRTLFARELSRRIALAKSRGIELHTLALPEPDCTSYLDLLVKHQISLVRLRDSSGLQPQSLRFGVWQVPITFHIPSASRWPFGGWEWGLSRALSKACKTGDLVHVVASLDGLASETDQSSLDRLLRVVQQYQQKGRLSVLTLHTLGESLMPQRRVPQGRSVLRAA